MEAESRMATPDPHRVTRPHAGGFQRRFLIITGLGVMVMAACTLLLVGWFEVRRMEENLQRFSANELASLHALVLNIMAARRNDPADVGGHIFNSWFTVRNADYPGRLWSVWGPKLARYMGDSRPAGAIKPPRDAIDDEAIRTGRPVGRFVDGAYRYSLPIVLGVTAGATDICRACHGKLTDAVDGDVIAVFSSSLSTAAEFAALRRLLAVMAALAVAAALTMMLIIRFTLGWVIGRPLRDMTAVMSALADGDKAVPVPFVERGDEVGRIARAVDVFKAGLIRADSLADERQAGLRERERQAQRLRGIFDHAADAIVTIDGDDHIVEFSQSAQRLFGYTEAEAVGGMTGASVVPPPYRERHMPAVRKLLAGEDDDVGGLHKAILLRKDGTTFPAEFTSARANVDGQVLLTSFIRDVTRQRDAEQVSRQLSQAVEQSPVSILIATTDGTITYVNQRFTDCTGYSRDEVIGQNPRILKSGLFTTGDYKHLWETITGGGEWCGEFNNRRKDGSLFWERASIAPIRDGKNRITHFLAIKEDITRFKEYEERLVHQANYDLLTGLPNRMMALDRLQQAIAHTNRNKRTTVLMFVDLDDFKRVNDTFGHLIGDKLLVAVSDRIKLMLRQADTLARLGGDEFLIMLLDVERYVDGEMVARKVLASLEEPFAIDNLKIYVGASIGITFHPADAATADVLLRNADSAMYAAKAAGRNQVRLFSAEMTSEAEANVLLENRLRAAFKARDLFLVYQPMISMEAGEVIGAEALLRWHHPEMGLVPPDRFIVAAEHIGLIVPMTEWVLAGAGRMAGQWQARTGRPIRMAVNVSSQSFRNSAIVDLVRDVVESNDLAWGSLELEITERVMIDDTPEIRRIMEALSAMGS